MKYSITINQLAIVQSGYDFDLVDGAVFDMLSDYTNTLSCQKKADNGAIYFNVPYKKVIDELPISGLKTPDSVYRRFKKLEQYGIIQFHADNKKAKQVWFAWGRNYEALKFKKMTGFKSDVETPKEVTSDLNPVQTGSKSVLRPDLNPTHNNTIPITNPSSNKLEEINTPQAAIHITTHTSTEFENVRIVEGQTFDLEEKTNLEPITPAAGKKPRTPKPAGNNITAVCAEISDDRVLVFFHGISEAWGEWIDYKRREKKGTYKTAKTEAATIAALAKGVNYDPEAGRAAIEHSIAHTYSGIYPPKGIAPTAAPAARYSLEDRPQANTPEQMKEELSRFYNANSALLSEAQKTAGTNYTGERLKSIVIDFCSNQVARRREGETFGQHHAALGLWLKRQKEFDTAKNPATTQHTAGPQPQAPLRSAAPVNYSIK